MVVYFSGTGNSKYVAERIAGSLQEKLICMNERIKSGDTGSVKTRENLVVVVPTYAWRIPRVVSDWIGQTEFVGAKNVWYVMSCGKSILSVSHMIHGVYDIDGVSLSMPVIVGADGIESDIPINLSGEEALKLKESADSLKKIIETIEL